MNILQHTLYIQLYVFYLLEKAQWLCRIKCILETWLIIHKQMEDIALQQWYTHVLHHQCVLHIILKKQLNLEKYLLMLNNSNIISLTKCRYYNRTIPVHNQTYFTIY